jgi:hypothetical protein
MVFYAQPSVLTPSYLALNATFLALAPGKKAERQQAFIPVLVVN